MEPVVQDDENLEKYTIISFVNEGVNLANHDDLPNDTDDTNILLNHLIFNAVHITSSMDPSKY